MITANAEIPPPMDMLFPYWYLEVFAPWDDCRVGVRELEEVWATLHGEFFACKERAGRIDVGTSDSLLREMIRLTKSERGWL